MTKTPDQHEREMLERFKKSQQGSGMVKVKPLICPEHYGNQCKLCEATHTVFKNTKKGNPIRDKASKMNRKTSYYSNIILPSINPSEVKIFEYGYKIWEQLMGLAVDPKSEYVDMMSHQRGRNVFINKHIPPIKEQTSYKVEPRVAQTPLPDMSVVQRMYNLDDILALKENATEAFIFQTALTEGRTEVRFLPSWLGPKNTVFYVEVPYHYMPQDEFDAIQRGEVNPFPELLIPGKEEVIILQPQGAPPTTWAEYVAPTEKGTAVLPEKNPVVERKLVEESPPTAEPGCIGTFVASSPLCTDRCAKLGFMERCKEKSVPLSSEEDKMKALRETARRLYK